MDLFYRHPVFRIANEKGRPMSEASAKKFAVKVVEYTPDWSAAFEAEALLLEKAIGDNLVRLFHIGSTSVPGLKAKPIIDILPVVLDIERLDAKNGAFAAAGYEAMGEFGIPGRRYFHKGGVGRTHHVHAFQYDCVYPILRHVAFRDYLRAHADVRDAYGELKTELAARFPNDIDGYCDGKDAFVKRVEAEALLWYWKTRKN